MKVAMMGAGAYGRALAGVLGENGHTVEYYDPVLKGSSVAAALRGAEATVMAVPSGSIDQMLPQMPPELPLVVATKGILGTERFAEFQDWMVLSGPGFAQDIVAHRKTMLTATDERILTWFGTGYLDFDTTLDRLGVLMCGALKNVYAIGAGWLGLERSTTEWEAYITEVAEEMQALLNANGAEAKTVNLACGIGDLRLTAGWPSRNFEFGTKVRRNPAYQPEKTVGGLATLNQIQQGAIVVPETAKYLKIILGEMEAGWV